MLSQFLVKNLKWCHEFEQTALLFELWIMILTRSSIDLKLNSECKAKLSIRSVDSKLI